MNTEKPGMKPLTQGSDKINLWDLSPEKIGLLLKDQGEKPYRSEQLTGWLFRRNVVSWDEMTDISAKTRSLWAEEFSLTPLVTALETLTAPDLTRKIVWSLTDGHKTESVLIPQKDHVTLCLSSQVGCNLGCRFCRTGEMGLTRNLTQGEILGQVFEAKKFLLNEEKLTNLVFMGMGEPLLNLDSVLNSLSILTSPKYAAISGKHISLSTAGIASQIPLLAESGLDFGLTISLGGATDGLRDQLMPINRRYPLAVLKKTLLDYPLKKGRRVTIAYVLLKGINDSPKDAADLSRFIGGLKTKINLIPFNPWPGADFERPHEETILKFRQNLLDKHHTVMIRQSKGLDIAGACGQLAGQSRSEKP
jgi:23S rRNA (adenine2503-C2)-methyltransferase